MPPEGFEPTILAGEQPQTYALNRAATGTGILKLVLRKNMEIIQHIRENKSVYKKQTSCFFLFRWYFQTRLFVFPLALHNVSRQYQPFILNKQEIIYNL